MVIAAALIDVRMLMEVTKTLTGKRINDMRVLIMMSFKFKTTPYGASTRVTEVHANYGVFWL